MTGGVRVVHQQSMDSHNDAKSIGSYRSTHTTRSSVLERAREYNRRIDEQKHRRSKSMERQSDVGVGDDVSTASGTPRSQSAGRISSNFPSQQIAAGNRPSTRERAMASVQRETLTTNNTVGMGGGGGAGGSPLSVEANHATPRSRVSGASAYSSHVSRPSPTTPRMSGGAALQQDSYAQQQQENVHPQHSQQQPQQRQQRHHPKVNTDHHHNNNNNNNNNNSHNHHPHQQAIQSNRSSTHHTNRSSTEHLHNPNSRNAPTPREVNETSRKNATTNHKSSSQSNNSNHNNNTPKVGGVGVDDNNQEAVVTPELLVDALSGHEDGLLAIAERLMEHYDSGYDVMGEAIIDAFADVQKLFQHVVEAAHMEGAAFEASRREEEITELRKQAAAANELNGGPVGGTDPAPPSSPTNNGGGPSRHDEFIDQDVKDILTESIRKGSNYRNSNKFTECYQLYEQACQSASALLPVDSDHRGRLQLSIARAESMTHERACAILRYAMDDVLRSGLRAGSAPLPDPSQRADVVLTRPKGHPSITGATGVQSSEEALNSLVEEMREVMNAPVYNNTPLQNVAKRFLAALADAQKAQQKNEEKLEQNLAKLKGDFLLARAEWEEKLNSTQETADVYKEKYQRLKDSVRKGHDNHSNGNHNSTGSTAGSSYLDHARSALASQQQRVTGTQDYDEDAYSGHPSIRSSASRAGSQAGSISSGLASHARDGVRSLVGSFACGGNNARTGGVVSQELQENRDAEIREMAYRHDSGMRDRDRRRTNDNRRNSGNGSINMSYSDRSFSSEQSGGHQRRIHTPHSVASGSTRSKSSRSFREYSRSPQRVDF